MTDNPASWQPDPTGKHDHRYWDGSGWTDNVADAGVASIDPYEAPVPTAAVDPAEAPTVVTPVQSGDTTATWPAARPAAPPPYVPPTPVPDGGGTGGNKRGLLIGGAILAAVALVVIAILALGGGDDDETPVADASRTTTTTQTDSGPETLEDLRDACAGGDLSKCDDLFYSADRGSDMETFGSTCGGTAPPQEGACEATNGGEDALGTDELTDQAIEQAMAEIPGLTDEQAECLSGKLKDAMHDGTLTEDQVPTAFFGYLADCDISLDDITGD